MIWERKKSQSLHIMQEMNSLNYIATMSQIEGARWVG
jgi:hypothetical protein